MPLQQKRAAADVILSNDSSEQDLIRKVDDWIQSHGGFNRMPRKSR